MSKKKETLIEDWKVSRFVRNESTLTFLPFKTQAYFNAYALKRLSGICYYKFRITTNGIKLSFSSYPKKDYVKFNGRINTSSTFGSKTTFLMKGPLNNLKFTNISKKTILQII
jgi:hypothetical protein